MTGWWAWVHDGFEILGAVAAAGAVIVALVLANRERAERKRAEAQRDASESELKAERRAAAEATRRAQAEHVAGWFEAVVLSTKRFGGGNVVQAREPRVRIGNYSNAPVFDVSVTAVRFRDDATLKIRVGTLPPSGEAASYLASSTFHEDDMDVDVMVEFRDVAGVRWKRYHDGRLEEISGDS